MEYMYMYMYMYMYIHIYRAGRTWRACVVGEDLREPLGAGARPREKHLSPEGGVLVEA